MCPTGIAPHNRKSTASSYAKISPPDAALLLTRQRLHRRLDKAQRAVIWVSGPAGAGKSSLLAAWGRQFADALRWYRVDNDDRDIASFFDWFGKLLDPAQQAALPGFDAAHMLDVPHFARRFFRQALSLFPDEAVLVLDNVHEASESEAFLQVLQTLIEERPPGMTLVLCSRQAPGGMFLAHLINTGNLHLTSWELSCSDGEAVALAESQGLARPTAELLRRADGWMAAVALLMRQTQTTGVANADTAMLTDEQLFAALAAPAFASLSDVRQCCLLVNAYSPWIDPDTTGQLCDGMDVTQELDALWRAQFFLQRQNVDGRIQYNCHALLRAFLQQRARERWPESVLQSYCVAHARCCMDRGDIDAAVLLYARAEEWQVAAQLIGHQAPGLVRLGKTATLLEWIQRIPLAQRGELPALWYWEGVAFLLFHPERAILCLQKAYAIHIAQDCLLEALLDVCAMIDAYFGSWEGWPEARQWVDELARLYTLFDGKFPSEDLEVQVLGSGTSLLYIHLGHALVQRWQRRSEILLHASHSPENRARLSMMLVAYAWWTGEMVAMREIALLAQQSLAKGQPDRLVEFHLSIHIGSSVYSDGHAVDVPLRGYFDHVLKMSEEQGIHLFDLNVWCLKCMEAMMLSDSVTGAAALQKAQVLYPGKRGARHLLKMTEVAQRLAERDWQGAVELATQHLQLSPDLDGWDCGRHLMELALAQALCMRGEYAAARAQGLATRAAAAGLPEPYLLSLDMRLAHVHAAVDYAEGNLATGDQQLRKALGIARERGYRHLHPWWSPALHAPLLARALEADIETPWVTRLIRQQRIRPPAVDVQNWPYLIRIHLLGRFSISVEGAPLPQQGKAQRKVLELLKLVAALGGRAVPVETLADILWPDSDGAAALAAFDVTLHRARKLLHEPNALLLHDGQLSINTDLVWLDLAALGHMGARLARALGRGPLPSAELTAWVEKLLRFYPAPVLANEPEVPWVLTARDIWRRRVGGYARQLGEACAAVDQALARTLQIRLQAADPLHFTQAEPR